MQGTTVPPNRRLILLEAIEEGSSLIWESMLGPAARERWSWTKQGR